MSGVIGFALACAGLWMAVRSLRLLWGGDTKDAVGPLAVGCMCAAAAGWLT